MASCYQYYPIGNNKSQDEVADEVGKEIHIEVFLKKLEGFGLKRYWH